MYFLDQTTEIQAEFLIHSALQQMQTRIAVMSRFSVVLEFWQHDLIAVARGYRVQRLDIEFPKVGTSSIMP